MAEKQHFVRFTEQQYERHFDPAGGYSVHAIYVTLNGDAKTPIARVRRADGQKETSDFVPLDHPIVHALLNTGHPVALLETENGLWPPHFLHQPIGYDEWQARGDYLARR